MEEHFGHFGLKKNIRIFTFQLKILKFSEKSQKKTREKFSKNWDSV